MSEINTMSEKCKKSESMEMEKELMGVLKCPVCGSEVEEPYGNPHYDGGRYFECSNFDCGFSYRETKCDNFIKLERGSLIAFLEAMKKTKQD